ncbi:MAG: hypothetical protein JWP87_294 [Labilithrix sp.]|nr:hypothetical protein [Labilithrix sp.]
MASVDAPVTSIAFVTVCRRMPSPEWAATVERSELGFDRASLESSRSTPSPVIVVRSEPVATASRSSKSSQTASPTPGQALGRVVPSLGPLDPTSPLVSSQQHNYGGPDDSNGYSDYIGIAGCGRRATYFNQTGNLDGTNCEWSLDAQSSSVPK